MRLSSSELAVERAASMARMAARSKDAIERVREASRCPLVQGFLCGRASRSGIALWFPRPDQGGRRKAAE